MPKRAVSAAAPEESNPESGPLRYSLAAMAQPTSPDAVTMLAPPGAIAPTGPWSVGARAGDFVFVAGMRGIDPKTNGLVAGDEARIRQAFMNMKLMAIGGRQLAGCGPPGGLCHRRGPGSARW